VTLTVDPACQVLLLHGRGDSHRRFLRDGEVSGQTKGTNGTQTLATRLTPFSPRRSHRKGLAVDHGGSAEVLGATPELSGR